jgi:hypothetical protein
MMRIAAANRKFGQTIQKHTWEEVMPNETDDGLSAIGDTLTTVRSRRCAATQAAHPTKGMRT